MMRSHYERVLIGGPGHEVYAEQRCAIHIEWAVTLRRGVVFDRALEIGVFGH